MIVVSDTSPLTSLWAIGRVELLETLFNRVFAPEAVRRELAAVRGQAEVFAAMPWFKFSPAPELESLEFEEFKLGLGEVEAISLAVKLKADYLLIDEELGRSVARRFGLTTVGAIGILLESKRVGLISRVRPELDALRAKAGFWIARPVYDRALQLAGE
ncbi:MAG: DUF3368 domain-containing protein [Candidatus Sumerlaeota bacterium]|nr:DUF3368 domain-containing protein [Candidatus Sumerlaeota bacterium]